MMNYEIIIAVWFAISLLTLLLFKYIPRKMKQVEDKDTKNSLYTILIFLGVPLLMVSVLAPAVFLIGDKNMDNIYRIVWGGLCLIYIVYFLIKQRTRK